ncbi:hypothetical protein N7491_011038 [Penicillium cf. griseofulvum]|uniref:Uncharacterized protein n=1 Tax=Penicillium cf. griseofulvum TaxID=2972120 RepID=A0A9W9T6D9_9EURO|nr:hypothetical protein N7472_001357 [Penicillium cf. griseofulvum]KAJ5422593.1 hypothetical protein N7491_011038 [Penicillium cf. griseofulvum]
MPPKKYLTTGLRHLPKPRALEPGEAFVVRYKNSLRQYKSDVWIGIVLPDRFGPSRHINRRPVGAQPADGTWVTHLKDRVYSMYLPGRNMYKWVGLQDLYVLNEKTPNVLQRAQRQPDAKIWDDIIEIVRGEPGLEFWKNMALQELGAKGKRGKELRIVLPSGHEDLVSCGESHADSESEEEKDEKQNEHQEASSDQMEPLTGAEPASYNGPAVIRSFSDARPAQRIQLRQSLGSLQDAKSAVSASEIPFADRESSNVTTTQQFSPRPPLMPPTSSLPTPSSLVTPPTTMTQNTVPKVENETSAGISDVASQQPIPEFSIFDLTVSHALKHVFLDQPEAAKIKDVFLNAATLESQPDYLQIREYLSDGEFPPRLITLKNSGFSHPTPFPALDPRGNTTIFRLVGDQMGIGQNFKLKGVSNSLDLENTILVLGRVYLQARRFGLMDLVYRIAFKLQVAWNCYPELYQSKPLLEVAALAFAGRTEFDEADCDYLQAWLIHFISEASDLLTYNANEQFWSLLRAYPRLQEKVLNLRTLAHVHNPELYGNTRVLLESRGLGNL